MDLSPAGLLAVWERGQGVPVSDRSRLLLELAIPGRSGDELTQTSISARDRALTRLRQSLFGNTLSGYVDCPCCGGRLSLDLDLAAMNTEAAGAPDDDEFVTREGLRFRAPNCGDLTAVADAGSATAALQELLRRCCNSRIETTPSPWGDALVAEVEAGIAALDPGGELCLDFTCANCGHVWQSTFDPAVVLWEEIESHATSLLHAVHGLAAAYGWSERDILALPTTRRAAYLRMLGQ